MRLSCLTGALIPARHFLLGGKLVLLLHLMLLGGEGLESCSKCGEGLGWNCKPKKEKQLGSQAKLACNSGCHPQLLSSPCSRLSLGLQNWAERWQLLVFIAAGGVTWSFRQRNWSKDPYKSLQILSSLLSVSFS